MTNLEKIKACADAMGYKLLAAYQPGDILFKPGCSWQGLMYSKHGNREYLFLQSGAYDPLHDDAQAMALLKKFELRVDHDRAALNDKPTWYAQTFSYERNKWNKPAEADDLNRAIVECVAAMHRASTTVRPK